MWVVSDCSCATSKTYKEKKKEKYFFGWMKENKNVKVCDVEHGKTNFEHNKFWESLGMKIEMPSVGHNQKMNQILKTREAEQWKNKNFPIMTWLIAKRKKNYKTFRITISNKRKSWGKWKLLFNCNNNTTTEIEHKKSSKLMHFD